MAKTTKIKRAKKSKKRDRQEKVINLPVSKFIDTRYRDYALYVLTSRGIPSFYDGLTPVQRFILMNTPAQYVKTLSVVGRCMDDGYHHGDCLDYDTEVRLADGTTVKIGEWAQNFPKASLLVVSKTENDEDVITIAHSPRIGHVTSEYLEIELETGEKIRCTENHLFYVNGEWVEAKNLTENMDIFNFDCGDI